MGNTELRRIEGIDSENIYFVSKDGFLYRKMKHKPRERQLLRQGCHGVTLGIVKNVAKIRKVQRLSKGRYSYAPSRVGGRATEAQGIVRNYNEDIV